MIDLHSHFLPGVDDGASDMDMCLAMLRQAQDAGITHLLATPHVNEHSTTDAIEKIHNTFQKVQQKSNDSGFTIQLQLAAEVRFDSQILTWSVNDWVLAGGNKKYLIFELPIQGLPLNLEEIIFKLGLKHITPILAHPERNTYIQRNPGRLTKWIELGCLMQMNAGSITGHFGSGIADLSWHLMRNNNIHFVCSDAHDTKKRKYDQFRRAYDRVAQKINTKYADYLFRVNPQKIWNGEQVSLPPAEFTRSGSSTTEKWWRRLKLLLNRPIIY